MKSILFITAVLLGTALAAAAPPSFAQYPDRPIKIIVPTSAGGAVDGVARIFQRALKKQSRFDAPIVVSNMPGAGGTIGTRAIKNAKPDGYTIGLWHKGLVTSALMGVVNYDYHDFDLIGSTGFSYMGLGVNAKSGPDSFKSMLKQAKQKPGSIKVAVNVGLPVYFVPLMISQANGGGMRMVQVGGGAKRLASVLGNHTDTAAFSIQELVRYQKSGLKPVVVLAKKRVPQLPNVPTAEESGINVYATNLNIWLAPKGIPKTRIKVLVSAFKKAMQDPAVKKQLKAYDIEQHFISAKKVASDLDQTTKDIRPLVKKARAAAQ